MPRTPSVLARILLVCTGLSSVGASAGQPGLAGPYDPIAWTMGPIDEGTTEIDLGASGLDTLVATYDVDLGLDLGVSDRSADLTVVADATGTASFTVTYEWIHAWFNDEAHLHTYTEDASGTPDLALLYEAEGGLGSPPFQTTVHVVDLPVVEGRPFGIRVGGSNFDVNAFIRGTVTVSDFEAPVGIPVETGDTGGTVDTGDAGDPSPGDTDATEQVGPPTGDGPARAGATGCGCAAGTSGPAGSLVWLLGSLGGLARFRRRGQQ